MTTQTRECVHNGVAQKTKRLQGQSNLNAWEEPRDTHDQTQTNKTRTNQTPNKPEQKPELSRNDLDLHKKTRKKKPELSQKTELAPNKPEKKQNQLTRILKK